MNIDGAEDLIVSVNSAKNLSTISNSATAVSLPLGILCVKAAMLLQVSCRMSHLKLLVRPFLDGIVFLFVCDAYKLC